MVLRNQGKLIATFTTTAPNPGGFEEKYFSKVNLDLKKFFPS